MKVVEPLALNPHDARGLLAAIAEQPGAAAVLAALPQVEAPVHLVGGAVRDLLIGVRPRELDLVVEGDLAPLLGALGAAALDDHERFGTATVQLPDGTTIDIARARAEHYAAPGALPEVEPAPLEIDLHRRDSTLNAIAIDLRTGAIHAPGTALIDLQARVLRVLHLASFQDDPTRLWRLARHEVRLGADWDQVTWHLAQAAIAGGALQTVSAQRLAGELRLALREPDPIGALAAAARLGLPPRLELDALRLHQGEQLAPPECHAPDVVLAAVASDDPMLPHYLERTEERALIEAALTLRLARPGGRRPGPLDDDAPGSVIATRFEGLPLAAVATAPDTEPARRWLSDLRHRALAITGDLLLDSGVPQGAAVGRGLAAARTALLDGGLAADDRDGQLRVALAAAC
jgi:tRNA nucleotidyltransferase (CCA-adding enzyme)